MILVINRPAFPPAPVDSWLKEPEKRAILRDLAGKSRHGVVTLVFGAKDELHNNAMALKHVIDAIAGRTD